MSVNPLSGLGLTASSSGSTTGVSGTTGTSGSTNPGSQLGESAFLTLLSAELKYQNPLQPMNNTQFVAELAQFSQLSAVTKQTSTLNQILAAVQGTGSIVNASQLIGKTVTTSSGKSGQVTGVSSTSSGITFDVSGLGTVKPSAITQVTAASSSSSSSSTSGTGS